MNQRLLVIILLLSVFGLGISMDQVIASISSTTLPEGMDFATLILRDPWDMDQFTDVSQYLNQSGTVNYLTNISIHDGLFSATSVNDAQFFVLWPGYNTATLIGKVGHNYPIVSSQYHCLYLAMNVSSSTSDYFQVFWFHNELLNGPGGFWGGSSFYDVIPNTWYLYKVDLGASPIVAGNSNWNSNSWQGLRIDPTTKANTPFSIDWVRLTDCSPATTTISLGGSGTAVDVFITQVGTSRTIKLGSSNYLLNGNTLTLDVQGLQPGDYLYTVNRNGSTVNTGTFTVNQTPIVNFDKPSYTSGIDYATQTGNPWDMSNSSDVKGIFDLSYSFVSGLLDTVTQPNKDPRIVLNSPMIVNASDGYRYLTFRLNTSGAYQNVPMGMIARWIWIRPGVGSGDCALVSQDIPFDVGWQNYSIDLYDTFDGLAEETSGNCNGLPLQWKDTNNINLFRFDPNENITPAALHQQLDWIKLTKMDQATKSQPFTLRIYANKSLAGIDLSFYYTTDRSNPTANILSIIPPGGGPPVDKYRAYLPAILNGADTIVTPGQEYQWDTSNVVPGIYYICVKANDGYNTGTYCSDAPVYVTP